VLKGRSPTVKGWELPHAEVHGALFRFRAGYGDDLGGPTGVCLGGLSKAVRSAASPRDYRRIRQYADEFRKRRTVYGQPGPDPWSSRLATSHWPGRSPSRAWDSLDLRRAVGEPPLDASQPDAPTQPLRAREPSAAHPGHVPNRRQQRNV